MINGVFSVGAAMICGTDKFYQVNDPTCVFTGARSSFAQYVRSMYHFMCFFVRFVDFFAKFHFVRDSVKILLLLCFGLGRFLFCSSLLSIWYIIKYICVYLLLLNRVERFSWPFCDNAHQRQHVFRSVWCVCAINRIFAQSDYS